MIAETRLLMEKHKIVTLPKKIIDALIAKGWKDGQVFVCYDETADSLQIMKAEQILQAVNRTQKKEDTPRRCFEHFKESIDEPTSQGWECIKKVY